MADKDPFFGSVKHIAHFDKESTVAELRRQIKHRERLIVALVDAIGCISVDYQRLFPTSSTSSCIAGMSRTKTVSSSGRERL